jgi:TRAP-type C4-dicarboxylate transport system permease small subunit
MTATAKIMVDFMLRVCRIIGKIFMVVSCILFSLLVLLVFSGSVMRYVVGTPLAVADETASLLFLSGAILTLTHGYLDKKLIRISLFWDKLSSRPKQVADAIGTLAGAVALGIAFWATVLFAWDNYTLGSRTVMTDIPLWPWAMSIPLSLGLMTLTMFLTALAQLLDLLNNGPTPKIVEKSS